MDYRPRTVERYHEKLRGFLRWLDGRPLRGVEREDVERYLLYRKAQRQRVAYTIRYTRETLAAFFQWLMQYCPIKANPAAGLRIRLYYPQPERLDLFSRSETSSGSVPKGSNATSSSSGAPSSPRARLNNSRNCGRSRRRCAAAHHRIGCSSTIAAGDHWPRTT